MKDVWYEEILEKLDYQPSHISEFLNNNSSSRRGRRDNNMFEYEEEEEMRSKYDYNKNKKQKRGHPNKGGSNNDRQFNHNSRDRGRRNHNNRRGGRRKKMSKEDKYIMNNQSELENELISFYNNNNQQQEKEISISNTTISSLIWYHKNVEIDFDLISQIVNWIHSESDTMVGEIDLEEMNEEKNDSITEEDFPQSILIFLPGFNISFNLHCFLCCFYRLGGN